MVAVVALSSFALSAGVAVAGTATPGPTAYASCVKAQMKKAHKPVTAAQKKAIRKRCAKPAQATSAGLTTTASGLTVNADGTITALPSNFPKNPTAQDIASLGLTRDSKVDPNLRLPQPSGKPLVAPKLADKIVPVGVYGTSVERVESGNSAGYEDVTVRWIEWDVQGGQGSLEYAGANTVGGQQSVQSVALNPNGSVRIIQGIPVSSANQLNGSNQYKIIGAVVPDYGQTAIPSSLSQNWQLGSQRATDVTGAGANVSVHGAWNPWWARADGSGGDDGYVNLDGSGNMVGTY
jgi:hypothetical protein